MQPKQLPPLKKSLITIGVLAIASLFSFLVVDESLMTNARLESLLPGDLLDVINHIGAFGHGAGCLVAVLLILNFDANGRRGIKLVLGSIVLSTMATSMIKVLVQRPRPNFDPSGSEFTFNEALFNHAFQSFPSGHTATAFSLALSLSILYPRARKLLFSFAVIAAFQRVVSQNHFVSDVLAGAAVGILSAQVAVIILRRLEIDFIPPTELSKSRIQISHVGRKPTNV